MDLDAEPDAVVVPGPSIRLVAGGGSTSDAFDAMVNRVFIGQGDSTVTFDSSRRSCRGQRPP